MRFLLVVCGLVAATAGASPAPGTPGNSGGSNPHGAPPGQGGPVPGNAGANNPHGTPPGQRISPPATGSRAASGAATPSGGDTSAISQPAGGGAQVGAWRPLPVTPVLPADEDGIPLGGLSAHQPLPPGVAEVVRRIKGWEPNWVAMADRFSEVDVRVKTSVQTADGITRTQDERYLAKDGAWRTEHISPESGIQTWLLRPPLMRTRNGQGPWRETEAGPGSRRRSLESSNLPIEVLVMNAWGAMPVAVAHGPGRTTRVDFLVSRGGRMHWELDDLDGHYLLHRLDTTGSDGRLAWIEERTVQLSGTYPILIARKRQTGSTAYEMLTEVCVWRLGAGVVSDLDLMP